MEEIITCKFCKIEKPREAHYIDENGYCYHVCISCRKIQIKESIGKNKSYHDRILTNPNITVRKCTMCNNEYPLNKSYFYKDKYNDKNFKVSCKVCNAARDRDYYQKRKLKVS